MREQIDKMRTNKSQRSIYADDDLPILLPHGALGEKEKPKPWKRTPPQPTPVKEPEYYDESPRNDPPELDEPPMPDESSELTLSWNSDLFKPSNKGKSKIDDLDLHLWADEYDSENLPAPKFKKWNQKHIYEDTTSVRSKYNKGSKWSP